MITRTYDSDGRFEEGGQTVRRDGMVLRSERTAQLHLIRPDSHHRIETQPERSRLDAFRDWTRRAWHDPIPAWLAWLFIGAAVVAVGYAAGRAF